MRTVAEALGRSSYSQLLQRQEWKDFSSFIRRDRGNACECCRRTRVQTQTHHVFYDANKKPWEHDPTDMVLLCSECHKELHEELKKFRKFVFKKLQPGTFRVLNGALAVALSKYDSLEFVHSVAELAASPRSVTKFAYAWNAGNKPE